MAASRLGFVLSLFRGERLALALLVAFFCVSLFQVLTRRSEVEAGEDEIVLRLCHWQLELACREAFDAAFARYNELYPNVRIVQQAVGGNTGAYNQWLATQILGNTAPDLIEVPGLPYPILLTYCSRYFIPSTRYVMRPNPYNEGTSMEGVPWRETFVDALNCAYVPELQEYYGLPMTLVNVRMYYNVDLLKRLTGLDRPPADFREFLAACAEIKSHTDDAGRPYVPIAGSLFSYNALLPRILMPLTHNVIYDIDGAIDRSYDGYASQDELYFAWIKKMIDFTEPPFHAAYKAMRYTTDQFQEGWNGMDRDQSLFVFTQQRAVMIPTGTWDYRSLALQSPFEIGVAEFPVPSPNDPEFGDVVAGPIFEKPIGDARFVINARCKHPEAALEFLRWFLSQETNAWFCGEIGWLPSIRGAKIPKEMVAFQPSTDGVQGIDIAIGNQTNVSLEQLKPLYWLGRIDYEEFRRRYARAVDAYGRRDYDERTDDQRRFIYMREITAAGMRGRFMTSNDPFVAERLRSKYYDYTCDLVSLPQYVLYRDRVLEETLEDVSVAKGDAP